MSDSVQPHRQQPTRLPHPWDSPGKNTGVGCHFLLQCVKVKSESEVAQSCPTLCNPMDCIIPGFSVFHSLWSLLKFMFIESMMLSNYLILCHPLLLLPSVFPMSQLFSWGDQRTGVSALASFLPKKSQGWSPSEWTGRISTKPLFDSSTKCGFSSSHVRI